MRFDLRPACVGLALSILAACGSRTPPVAADAAAHAAHVMPSIPATTADWAQGAQLFTGLGDVHRAISTKSAESQKYFDQGLALLWGFNHDEATRSFAKAAELDPHCAICYWGVSLTVGPNYNLPALSEPRAKVAYEALGTAQSLVPQASPVERALIAALARRYPDAKARDPEAALPVLTDYAEAMREVAEKYPDDLDVRTLYAESMMNLHAWKLWAPDGSPAPGTREIVAALEYVLAKDPHHAGANHYYIHALEASRDPGKAEAAADRLGALLPAAGHLVHMPSHIYQRIGRYEDAAEANRRADAADLAYVARTAPPDYYSMYTAHNVQFLSYSAGMEGRRAEAVAAADRSRAAIADAMLLGMAGSDWYVAEASYSSRVRFGLWDELLAMPAPDARLPGLTGGWLYGRGMAQAATGHIVEAKSTLADLQKLVATLPAGYGAGQNALADVLAVALPMVEARVAGAEKRGEDEIAALQRAVAAEDHLGYDEPRNWYTPARHALGAALLAAGRASEAEAVYHADLKLNPGNGWALRGLELALRAEGRRAAADAAATQYAKAFARADVQPASSVY